MSNVGSPSVIVRGLSIDNAINQDEMDYITVWRDSNLQYSDHKEVSDIIEELKEIQCEMEEVIIDDNNTTNIIPKNSNLFPYKNSNQSIRVNIFGCPS